MELSSLRAPRPALPKAASVTDKRVQSILRDLETIRYCRPYKQWKKSEHLIYSVVQSLRKAESDHLLYTTAVWALVNIFRLFPEQSKEFMLSVGVASILHDILSSGMLSGATRQYASELCFYLSTNQPYPLPENVPASGPLKEFPEISNINRYKENIDNLSVGSDLSTIVNEKNTKHQFIPYRINEQNMAKLDALFSQGYENEMAASLPNPTFQSKYGFNDLAAGEGGDYMSDGSDDESVCSSISSNSLHQNHRSGGSTARSHSSQGSFPSAPHYGQSRITSSIQKNNSLALSKSLDFDKSTHSRRYNSVSAPSSDINSFTSPHRSTTHNSFMLNKFANISSASALNNSTNNNNFFSPQHYRAKNMSNERSKANNFRIGFGPVNETDENQADDDDSMSYSTQSSHNFYPESIATSSSNNQSRRSSMGWDISGLGLGSTGNGGILRDVHKNKNYVRPSTFDNSMIGSSLYTMNNSQEFSSSQISNMQFYGKLPKGIDAELGLRSPVKTGKIVKQFSVTKTQLEDFMTELDPLALNVGIGLHAKEFSTGSIASPDASDNEINDDDLFSDDDEDINVQNDSTWTERAGSDTNQYMIMKRMRIRAEKLVDHKFTKNLFTRKATIKDTQNLITRMESMFQLLDPQGAGFISWESFSRVILAVAPSHLLRADVLAFMEAQTDDPKNMIDYNEFIISGKVMVIEGQQDTKNSLPIEGWLNRQRNILGSESTYSWQNHVKWYQQRKARAVIWLIRRAARSLKQAVRLEDARIYLYREAKKAIAVTYLLEIAHKALGAKERRYVAKRNLMLRCIHARKWVQQLDESQRYLSSLGKAALLDLRYMENIKKLKAQNKLEELKKLEEVGVKQASYGNLYKVHTTTILALNFLRNQVAIAQRYCSRQDEALSFIRAYVAKVQVHQLVKAEALSWLLACSDRSYQYCIKQDNILLGLMRLGQNAYKFIEKKEKHMNWITARGTRAINHLNRQDLESDYLAKLGSFTLSFMNQREAAYAYMVKRKQNAIKLIAAQKEAIIFLQSKPQGYWAVEMDVQKAHIWLVAKGKRAVQHEVNKFNAFKKLQFIASRGGYSMRRSNLAYADLLQIGQQARLKHFQDLTKDIVSFIERTKQETYLMAKTEVRNTKAKVDAQSTTTIQQKWKAELNEAFNWLVLLYSKPALKPPKRKLLGRIGFRRLLLNGKYLGIKPDSLDEHFKAVDPASACFITFDAIWVWFLHHAERRNKQLLKNNKPPFSFKAVDIISLEERVQINLMRRVNSEQNAAEELLNYDRDQYKRKKTGKKGPYDDDTSSEEEDAEFDEDAIFSDLEYLKSGGADIGKLMRFLTRRKEAIAAREAEKAAAAAAAAEAEAQARLRFFEEESARMSSIPTHMIPDAEPTDDFGASTENLQSPADNAPTSPKAVPPSSLEVQSTQP